jgi:predicted nucleotidyltransferase component of viral defense system
MFGYLNHGKQRNNNKMITKEEIQEIASQKQLDLKIIEKDYVLSWILAGIHQHKDINNTWIFKGGTCLKKCYFETYRFSEDLDFTILETINTNQNYKKIFTDISNWIYDNSGIELPE